MKNSAPDVLQFWFEDSQPQQWFQVSPEFDAQIKERFEDQYNLAAEGLCDDWKNGPDGCLALCLLLDQFPRNMFRDTPKAFATDKQALLIAKHAIAKGFDQVLQPIKRRFIYLPYEHSENINDQRTCVELFEKMQDEDPLGYEYAVKHLKVIEKFNRFPHRNAVLGRDNTEEEEEYLAQPGAGF
ncbi:MAG: DUF924 family protein [Pseudomonadota bacterium]